MVFHFVLTRVLVALTFLSTVRALTSSPPFDVFNSTDNRGVAVAVNVPANGTDNLYFHYQASAKYQWAAFGIGSQMSNALIFVVYASQDGKNVTVGARTVAGGHSMPRLDDAVTVDVLNGSRVTEEGYLVVNAMCSGCRQWSSGKLDLSSRQQPMVLAVGPQQSVIQSDNPGESILQHSDHSAFTLDMTKATGEPGVPVLDDDDDGDDSDSPLPSDPDADGDDSDYTLAAHLFFMVSCFLFILPGGYLFLRVFDKVWVHAGVQSLGVVFLLAGVIAGIVCNTQHNLTISYHQGLGITTTVLVFAAFTLGLVSHRYYKRHQVRSPLMIFHRVVGPSAIVLGWGTAMSGFAYKGHEQRILPFAIAVLAVIIVVGGVTFMVKKHKVKKAALVTPAAQNFNDAYYSNNNNNNNYYGSNQHAPAPPAYGEAQTYYGPGQTEPGVAMQTFSRPFGQKKPEVAVHTTQI